MPHPYIHGIKLIIMMTQLVKQSVELFVETLPLATTDINTNSHTWHHLYSQECKLYGLMGQMSEDELDEYRDRVSVIQPEEGISY
jgi:hypothetical protein